MIVLAKRWLSVTEIAEELGIDKLRVHRYINKNSIDYDKRLKRECQKLEMIKKILKKSLIIKEIMMKTSRYNRY